MAFCDAHCACHSSLAYTASGVGVVMSSSFDFRKIAASFYRGLPRAHRYIDGILLAVLKPAIGTGGKDCRRTTASAFSPRGSRNRSFVGYDSRLPGCSPCQPMAPGNHNMSLGADPIINRYSKRATRNSVGLNTFRSDASSRVAAP